MLLLLGSIEHDCDSRRDQGDRSDNDGRRRRIHAAGTRELEQPEAVTRLYFHSVRPIDCTGEVVLKQENDNRSDSAHARWVVAAESNIILPARGVIPDTVLSGQRRGFASSGATIPLDLSQGSARAPTGPNYFRGFPHG